MTLLDEILDANAHAVRAAGDAGSFLANRRLCIVTCVDPRLTRFFPSALGVGRGHAVVIRVPGARVAAGSEVLRALAAAVYVNRCDEVLVIPHTDCGVARTSAAELAQEMRRRGVSPASVPGDLGGFFGLVPDLAAATAETVEAIRGAPFLPPSLRVHAAMMDIRTGGLELLHRGDGTRARSGPPRPRAPVGAPAPAVHPGAGRRTRPAGDPRQRAARAVR